MDIVIVLIICLISLIPLGAFLIDEEFIKPRIKEKELRNKQTRIKNIKDNIKDIIDNTMILSICDTSALMTNRTNYIDTSLYTNEELFMMNISYHIPTQVIGELHNHFKNPEKEKKARSGRKNLVEIKRYYAAQEVDISGVEPYKSSSVIGSDSLVDRQIVGYALKMLEGDYQFVVIATEDGGIQYDIIELRKSGYKIYSSDEEEQLKSDIRLYVEKELGERK